MLINGVRTTRLNPKVQLAEEAASVPAYALDRTLKFTSRAHAFGRPPNQKHVAAGPNEDKPSD